ncbi:MAG: hypothetical protein ACREAC_03290, partial [Blastocatellia bacterium]
MARVIIDASLPRPKRPAQPARRRIPAVPPEDAQAIREPSITSTESLIQIPRDIDDHYSPIGEPGQV